MGDEKMKGKVTVLVALFFLGAVSATFAQEEEGVALRCEVPESQRVDNVALDDVVAGFAQSVETDTDSKIILWDEAKKMDFTKRSSKKLRIEINY